MSVKSLDSGRLEKFCCRCFHLCCVVDDGWYAVFVVAGRGEQATLLSHGLCYYQLLIPAYSKFIIYLVTQ